MGLSVSPAIWQNFINRVLDEIPDRKHHLGIMDDCLIHSKRKQQLKHVTALLKALIRNGLKNLPKEMYVVQNTINIHGSYTYDQR